MALGRTEITSVDKGQLLRFHLGAKDVQKGGKALVLYSEQG